jgi:PqqD family protein of HPr-rel-A system
MKWGSPEFRHYLIENYDNEFILYNALSGETHVLNEESHQILLAIQSTSKTSEALLREILPDSDQHTLDQHLLLLKDWGLAEEVSDQQN